MTDRSSPEDEGVAGLPTPIKMTREGLLDGSILAAARAERRPGFTVLSDEEMAASMQQVRAACPDPSRVWIFGYGSLIWNPALDFVEVRPAHLHGWQRRFCLSSSGRGSAGQPGLILALDKGGSCHGVAFRIEKVKLDTEMRVLWHREMLADSYRAIWTTAETDLGDILVLAFVANTDHNRYVNDLSEAEVVERIAFAQGPFGTALSYFRNTLVGLESLGRSDPWLDALADRIEARLRRADSDR